MSERESFIVGSRFEMSALNLVFDVLNEQAATEAERRWGSNPNYALAEVSGKVTDGTLCVTARYEQLS